jgi:hypothetical protein
LGEINEGQQFREENLSEGRGRRSPFFFLFFLFLFLKNVILEKNKIKNEENEKTSWDAGLAGRARARDLMEGADQPAPTALILLLILFGWDPFLMNGLHFFLFGVGLLLTLSHISNGEALWTPAPAHGRVGGWAFMPPKKASVIEERRRMTKGGASDTNLSLFFLLFSFFSIFFLLIAKHSDRSLPLRDGTRSYCGPAGGDRLPVQ